MEKRKAPKQKQVIKDWWVVDNKSDDELPIEVWLKPKKFATAPKQIDFWADSDDYEEELAPELPSVSHQTGFKPENSDASSSRHSKLMTETTLSEPGSVLDTQAQAGYSKSKNVLLSAHWNRIRRNNIKSKLEKQERMLLKKMRNVSLSDNERDEKDSVEKKLQKLKKQKTEKEVKDKGGVNLKKKTKKKSVSFNSTVTTIYTTDLDTSAESEITSKDENSNCSNQENIGSGSDEGIEQDLQRTNNNNDIDSLDHHRSFEMAQSKFSDLSKAERIKLKNKRKLESGLATSVQKMTEVDDKNLKKRKFLEDAEQENHKRSDIVTSRLQTDKKLSKSQRKRFRKRFNIMTDAFDNISVDSD